MSIITQAIFLLHPPQSRSVKGDPLSPMLFLLIMEVLITLFRKAN
jgi:hypothetical protein